MTGISDVLSDVTAVEYGTGAATALVGKFLADCGCRVLRVQTGTPDVHAAALPAYEFWQRKKASVELAPGLDRIAGLLTHADILIVGENETEPARQDAQLAAAARANPRLIVLEVTGSPAELEVGGSRMAQHEILAQARTGLVFEQLSDRPVVYGTMLSTYGAALSGVEGILAALVARENTQAGIVLRTSLVQGALTWLSGRWLNFERPSGEWGLEIPHGVGWLIFECKDGRYLQIISGPKGALDAAYEILGISAGSPSPGPESETAGVRLGSPDEPENFFGLRAALEAKFRLWDSAELLDRLIAAGVPAEYVLEPGACWDSADVTAKNIIERDGVREGVGLPIRSE